MSERATCFCSVVKRLGFVKAYRGNRCDERKHEIAFMKTVNIELIRVTDAKELRWLRTVRVK